MANRFKSIDKSFQPKILKADQAGKIGRIFETPAGQRISTNSDSIISKIMVIHVGGKIGMVKENGSYVRKGNYLLKKLRGYSDLNDQRFVEEHFSLLEVNIGDIEVY